MKIQIIISKEFGTSTCKSDVNVIKPFAHPTKIAYHIAIASYDIKSIIKNKSKL